MTKITDGRKFKEVMYSAEVSPYWLQVPLRLTNSLSHTDGFLTCWDPVCGGQQRSLRPVNELTVALSAVRFSSLICSPQIKVVGIKT